MPRKRASSGFEPQSGQSKNPKTSNDASPQPKPRSNRWSAACVSANLDADYSGFVKKDYDYAFSYVSFCSPDDEDEEDERSDVDSDADGEPAEATKSKVRCDGGNKCFCNKPVLDHSEHPWVVTRAGLRKLANQHVHADSRNPDLFGYGVVEVVQNLVLDFVEASGNWKEQWAVCEAMSLFLNGDAIAPMTSVDDGDCANDTFCLIGAMFLTMLAKLESQGLLGPDSEIKNLGMVMALYICTTSDMRQYGIAEGNDDKSNKVANFHDADAKISAYAKKYNIQLRGPSDIDSCVDDLDDVSLPRAGNDPWGWGAVFKQYEKRYGQQGKSKIGGNRFDITAMSATERKSKSFAKRDPLGKEELNAIKQGGILQIS
ncbi:hypothetical protein ETB97_010457 [Aspergillus alliaceus]|uniref:Uncharacterized protein n=1 Tax=Petromyces alliaceus TaxID=209559 RepID=A0A8H6A8U4_PETAA|nr:hypothetical protein ETB97_010457 [Aspergillus burnettii]